MTENHTKKVQELFEQAGSNSLRFGTFTLNLKPEHFDTVDELVTYLEEEIAVLDGLRDNLEDLADELASED